VSINAERESRRHILNELGFAIKRVGNELHSTASITPEMHVPGTDHLRTSIFAAWADHLAGLLAIDSIAPRVPVTLELDVHLYRPAPGSGTVRGVGRTVKTGRSVFVAGIDFFSDHGEPIAIAAGSFMAAPDPSARLPAKLSIDGFVSEGRLAVPFADRAGCERRDPGVAALFRSEDGLNSSNSVNGGSSPWPPRRRCSRWPRGTPCARSGCATCRPRASDRSLPPPASTPGSPRSTCVTPATTTVCPSWRPPERSGPIAEEPPSAPFGHPLTEIKNKRMLCQVTLRS